MGKSYVENSLKRFLKRKVKITLGFVVAFMITGTGVFAAESEVINKSEINIEELKPNKNGEKKNFVLGENINKLIVSGNLKTNNNKAGVHFNLDLKEKDLEANLSRHEGIGTAKEHTYFENINITNGGNIVLNDLEKQNETGYKNNAEFIKHWANAKENTEGTIEANSLTVVTGKSGIKAGTSDLTGNAVVNYEVNELNITSNSYGIYTINNGKINIGTENKKVEKVILNAGRTGILTENSGEVKIEGSNSKESVLEVHTTNSSYGAITLRNDDNADKGLIDIKGFETVSVISEKSAGVAVNAMYSGNKGTVNIIGNKVSIAGSDGIYIKGAGTNEEHSTVNISGTEILKISATSTNKNAVKVTNGGSVALENSKNLILDGNIDIAGNETLKADINADFKSEISQLNGYIKTGESAESNIEFSNNAVWNNTGNSSVTELTLNNGVINNDSVDNNISVGTLKGNGGAVNMAAVIDETTGKAKSGKVTINNIEKENVKLDVNFKNTGAVEADGDKAQEYFEELAKNIETTDTDSKITGTAALAEGFVSGGYEADITINKDGSKVENVTYTGLNSMIEGMRDLATINLLTWRQEMNSLNKRMGELRNSTGEHGVWSRVYTGKIENGSKYDNDYQTYQVGYDKKYTVDNGVMFVGGLVSYTDGETDYALGHGENYSVGAGIYATWLNNDGQFADVVLKQSRLHNKFDVRSKDLDKSQSGDYNNWGTSLSGQYGKRFDLNDKFFIEPSVELTLGRVEDTTYTTSAGVDVHQDTMYSLVGNVGTSVGYKFSDKGNVYARAALVKEFQGDIDTEYEKDGALERTSEDLGDTWAEFGVGVNYRVVENMNVYVDVQKTGEATVDNKWQANLGFRYEF